MTKSEKIEEYYKNPSRCVFCNKVIEYNGVQPLHKALERKYCNIGCYNKMTKSLPSIVGIYCIENVVNKKRYIGQSTDIYKRWRSHRGALNCQSHSNKHLQRAWNKYGNKSFNFFILEECNENELNELEQYYINKYNTFYKGYNNDLGGNGRGRLTDEQKHQVSLRMKELNKLPEHREKLIKARESQAIPIYQIDLSGKIIKKWNNGAREASRILNYNFSCIWHCLEGNRKTYKNYIWMRVCDYNENTFNLDDYKGFTNPKPIYQYDLLGNFIRKWDNSYQANKEGFDNSSIRKVCNGKQDSYKSYVWSDYELTKTECQNIKTYFHQKNMVIAINENNEVAEYDDIKDIVKKNPDFNRDSISTALCKKTPMYGFIWVYYSKYNKDFDYSMLLKHADHKKVVYQYDKNLKYINSYNGLTEAYNNTKVKPSLISACCHGWQKSAGGYIWTYQKIA